MKKFVIPFVLIVVFISLFYLYNSKQEQELFDEYQQRYLLSIKTNNQEEFIRLASDIEKILIKNNSEKWQLMYVNILVAQLHEYKKALDIMETMPIMHKDAALGVGLCMLKEHLGKSYKTCYQNVIDNVPEPKYNDMNYWGAVAALNLPYTEEDINKSEIPRELLEKYLATASDRKKFLQETFP
ncbi:hypothetical protein HYE60_10260 [Aggregatibacter actinomycetemcomitans]|uniref:hypothetical protein n=1 Tax=Aggregatibacter actinomycetemcomitans TaxID=714 RepID=UPI00197BA886|nr:hypothetical protein [Aggregatibacter actinomycetemcomitans]MBN6075619.1 hypothetical protein [Aggregatibacter actinomycetemcomitans]